MADASGFPLYERRALLGGNERLRLPGQYGDMTAERLTGILFKLQRGDVQEWADLVQFALASDDLLISLYSTRVTRVAQADYQVVPNPFGDQTQARLAAEFVNELIGRVENWDKFVRNALHAIALGYSANEIEWDRDGANRVTYPRLIHYVHPNRFRYDEQWQLRLYDHGTRTGESRSMYGEPLWPASWIVHTHNELAGYPCDAGLMRMSIWRWLFRRWADTFWIQNLEKYGAPFIYAEVTQSTPLAVRQSIKENIVDLSIERAAIFEAGGKITIEPPAMGTGAASQHELYMDFAAKSLSTTWLGASDVTQPGENGSQAAVGGRISATTDPRMVTDGTNFCNTLHSSLFKWALIYNLHKFGGRMPPIPLMQLKTASDEAKVDQQDLASENAADREMGTGEQTPYQVRGDSSSPSLDGTLALPSGAPDPKALPADASAPADPNAPPPDPNAPADAGAGEIKKAETALNGAQVSSLVDVLNAVATGQIPRESAAVLIQVAYQMDATTADRLLGSLGQGFVPAPPPDANAAPAPANAPPPPSSTDASAPQPDANASPPTEASLPKASSRAHQARLTGMAKTSQIGLRSIGPLASALQKISGDPPR